MRQYETKPGNIRQDVTRQYKTIHAKTIPKKTTQDGKIKAKQYNTRPINTTHTR